LISLTRRAPTQGFLDLLKVNKRAALAMMQYQRDWTYAHYDQMTAGDYLRSLNFPPDAQQMLFDVFSRSFFNPGEDMSAAELLMMFHFYFAGNPEGLIFDVAAQPFSTAIWKPLEGYLATLNVDVRTHCSASRVTKGTGSRWSVELDGQPVAADHVVLAVNIPALQSIVAASPDLDDAGFRKSVDSLALTNPFAVWRLWLDKAANPERKPFAGTTGIGSLDNISLYHLFEDESREWVARNGGAVVELHAYGVAFDATEKDLRDDLMQALNRFYPEFNGANIIDERFLMRGDCPGFAPGSDAIRPDVATAHEGITLAGDFVRLNTPTALMERAVASGYLAANTLLAPYDVKPEPIYSVPLHGILGKRKQAPIAP
jgi:isorenieratene synthase